MSNSHPVFSDNRSELADKAPLYLRIKKLVRNAVAAGELARGDAIPGERDVADMLGVSRVTVRKAFSELVREGMLQQRRGSGTFVSNPTQRFEQSLSRLTSFSEDMKLRGLAATSEWLERSVGLPTPEEALSLSISPTDHISRLRRLRRADGVPLAIETAVVPCRFLDDPHHVGASLYETLAERGFRPVRALQKLHADALNATESGLLGLPEGFPALFIERISYLADGQIVEYTRSHYRGVTYDFVAELSLAPETPR